MPLASPALGVLGMAPELPSLPRSWLLSLSRVRAHLPGGDSPHTHALSQGSPSPLFLPPGPCLQQLSIVTSPKLHSGWKPHTHISLSRWTRGKVTFRKSRKILLVPKWKLHGGGNRGGHSKSNCTLPSTALHGELHGVL